jgi:predicted transcriptional regulator
MGATKTRIVYQANLNFKTVNPYIELLIKNELISIKDGQNKVYKTTNKGIEWLESFKFIQNKFSL